MKNIALVFAAILMSTPAFAGIEIQNDKSTDLKKLVITHWLSKETGPTENHFRTTIEQITVCIEKEGKTVMIVPVFMNTLLQENEITAIAWVSVDLLQSVRVSVSGFTASAFADGPFGRKYRYVEDRKAFELVKSKPLKK